ncbi:MAG TPA: cytochrome c [Burkholderiales bacterium]|nr:cytochrome c [Burkholderiales bacterium]
MLRNTSPARAGLFIFWLLVAPLAAWSQGDAKRGEYLVKAGGCIGCHTEAREGATPFAGGRALKTPFGTFYGPNITPHPDAGIGRWSQADFVRAMREGRRPDGANYYPAFPYPSFTRITDADLRDIWAYLRTLAPSAQPSRPHQLGLLYRSRASLGLWKRLFFSPGAFTPDPQKDVRVNRGAYLVQALGHCGECHTPRNALGGPKQERFLAGGKMPDGATASNLTPARLKDLSDNELRDVLTSGILPDGDVLAEAMGEVVRNTTSQLTPADLDALIAYLRSLPPLPSEPK